MHEAIKERLEEFLRGPGEQEGLAAFREHLASCESCREEVAEVRELAGMLRLLRAPSELETDAGFYARVKGTIEKQRRGSTVYAFLEPAFARRLLFASIAAVVVLGSYLVFTERTPAFGDFGPIAILASPASEDDLVGANPIRDRETVLLTLASYQE